MFPTIALSLPLAALLQNRLWYALPLIVAISLVYGATRDEQMVPILQHAFRAATWVVGFLAIIFGVLYMVSWSL
jgi:hypothetical protein